MARGISDFVDMITLRRETGGRALIRLKTYEMDRRAFQDEPVDELGSTRMCHATTMQSTVRG